MADLLAIMKLNPNLKTDPHLQHNEKLYITRRQRYSTRYTIHQLLCTYSRHDHVPNHTKEHQKLRARHGQLAFCLLQPLPFIRLYDDTPLVFTLVLLFSLIPIYFFFLILLSIPYVSFYFIYVPRDGLTTLLYTCLL